MQAADDIWTVPHQLPQQARTIIFNHQYDRPFVEPVIPRGYPAIAIAGSVRMGGIERRLEAVATDFFQIDLVSEVLDRRQYDFRREWQRRDDGPGRDGAVIRPVRHTASQIIEELALDAVYFDRAGAGAVTRSNSPATPAIARKLERIVHRVLLLNIRRATAVLEIVDALAAHELVLYAPKIDPKMR